MFKLIQIFMLKIYYFQEMFSFVIFFCGIYLSISHMQVNLIITWNSDSIELCQTIWILIKKILHTNTQTHTHTQP